MYLAYERQKWCFDNVLFVAFVCEHNEIIENVYAGQ